MKRIGEKGGASFAKGRYFKDVRIMFWIFLSEFLVLFAGNIEAFLTPPSVSTSFKYDPKRDGQTNG